MFGGDGEKWSATENELVYLLFSLSVKSMCAHVNIYSVVFFISIVSFDRNYFLLNSERAIEGE